MIRLLPVLVVALAVDPVGVGIGKAQVATLPCPLTASYRKDNAFARIIRGELPASLIAADKRVIAIIPLDWEHPGHALVIPKAAVRNLDDLSDRDALAMLHMIKRVAAAQQRALGSSGYSLQQNNGSRQDVCHLHVHVIPNTAAVPRVRATRAEMDAMAERLRAALPSR
ncbi:HIT domain-containing protein [Sphingomonas sp. 1P06PA]|uniref:HIT family protein n=1 Tax=Sphingomonas sp. 1P06PA TaxID=554121 RepID=UPI0039A64835